MSTLIIGDIHGCYDELQALLDLVGPDEDDDILAVGDLVDRGPDSLRVLEFFRDHPRASSLLGNHEDRHVRAFYGEGSLGFSHQIACAQMGKKAYRDACAYMGTLPIHREIDDALVVHAFWEPGLPLKKQKGMVLVGNAEGLLYLWEKYERPWYTLYDREGPIVVGHLDYLQRGEPFVYEDRVFCLDTGCAKGGALTGLLLPEYRLHTVETPRNHWRELKSSYGDLRPEVNVADTNVSWSKLGELLEMMSEQKEMTPGLERRRKNLREFSLQGEDALDRLLTALLARNAEILRKLKTKKDYDELPPDKQRKLYAARAGDSPLSPLLERAREGRLTRKALRKHFKKPRDLITFCQTADLLGDELLALNEGSNGGKNNSKKNGKNGG